MLNRSRRESPTGQRDRSASPTRRTPSRRDETTNRDNASNLGGDLGNDTNNMGGNSSNNTNDVSRNLDNATSSSELVNITSSLASRNDSDVSMFDVGGSQPPSYMVRFRPAMQNFV